ncbi:MAG: zf-HC2 domain-containing protein [Rhizobacter sp.]|nr:zf-HC2 domain-containing protein [Rhizobacter sp.]
MNLLHSCRKAAELLSQRMDEPLGWVDSLRLRMHLSMCGNCSNVEDQLACVQSATSDLFTADTGLDGEEPPSNEGVRAKG